MTVEKPDVNIQQDSPNHLSLTQGRASQSLQRPELQAWMREWSQNHPAQIRSQASHSGFLSWMWVSGNNTRWLCWRLQWHCHVIHRSCLQNFSSPFHLLSLGIVLLMNLFFYKCSSLSKLLFVFQLSLPLLVGGVHRNFFQGEKNDE